MKNPAFIHVGPHKTGSSAIQAALDVSGKLLERHGMFVPRKAGTKARVYHAELAGDLGRLARGEPSEAWRALSEQIRARKALPVLSCEYFSLQLMRAEARETLVDFLNAHDLRPHFIAYVRDYPSWLNSIYVQEAKRFYTSLAFADYLSEAFHRPRFDYNTLLGPLLDCDACDTTFIPFEAAATGGLEASFLSFLGIPENRQTLRGRLPNARAVLSGRALRAYARLTGRGLSLENANPNPGAKTVHVGRALARTLREAGAKPQDHRVIYYKLKQIYFRKGWYKDPFIGIDRQAQARIVSHYEASGDAFAQRAWGTSWRETFGERPYTPNVFEYDTASARDKIEVDAVISRLSGLLDRQLLRERDPAQS